MPRAKGYDRRAIELRNAFELVLFNARLTQDDLELLELLIQQEKRRRDTPSELMVNAGELVARLRKWNGEILKEIESK